MAYSEKELLEIRDEQGRPTGVVKPRGKVHRDGDLHGCSHMFVVRVCDDGTVQVLLQRRSFTKDSFPGLLDTSSAGHLEVGETYEEGAYRELKEELGVTRDDMKANTLRFLFYFRQDYQTQFYGRPFHDNEINAVFLAEVDWPAEKFTYEKAEIESVQWVEADELLRRINADDKEICMSHREYRMLYPYLKKIEETEKRA